jgi:formylmethanofuran dehydrogenase subunit C
VTDTITLTLRAPVERRVEADGLTPDRFATLAEREIAALPIWDGRHRFELGELFQVHGERSTAIRVLGDLANIDSIGAAMTAGELVIEGEAGRYVGARMTGGVLRVLGSAGCGAGLEMAGGVLDITGDAGDQAGAASMGASKGMLGGELIIRGRAGTEIGARMRRGLIVCGRAGDRAGEAMIAGSIIALGNVGADPGRYNKRGSIVALGTIPIPATYRYACAYHPPHVALTLRHLRSRFGLAITDTQINGTYQRHSGDMEELGRGEILAWSGANGREGSGE